MMTKRGQQPASSLAVLLVLMFSQQVLSASGDAESGRDREINEVIVRPEQSLINLRRRVQQAEQDAYEVFNRLNDEKRFEIHCSKSAPTGSGLDGQVCQAQFEIDANTTHARAYAENLRDYLDPHTLPGTTQSHFVHREALIAYHQKAYQAKMREIAESEPEFLDALIRYAMLKAEYQDRLELD